MPSSLICTLVQSTLFTAAGVALIAAPCPASVPSNSALPFGLLPLMLRLTVTPLAASNDSWLPLDA